MRILWLCNIMLPAIAEALGKPASNKEGWLTGLSERLLAHQKENNIELGICFPVPKGSAPVQGEARGISYFGFCEDVSRAECYDAAMEEQFSVILQSFRPDVVHAFGTEFPHTLAMTRCIQDKNKMLIGIQGLCCIYAKHYMADLPMHVRKRFLLRDFLKQDNLMQQQKKYVLRGRNEIEALQNTGHITGRTAWDKKAAEEMNPKAEYHFMNETLRAPFYEAKWEKENCMPHSIFMSQGNYPIKGLHYMLQALPKILNRFPDAKLYVSGDVITRYGTLMEKIKIGSYGKYCLDLIKKNGLEDKVVFLGRLDAEKMREQYLNSHVFVSPSSIENSPNSVGEAMLLGMPVVSSDAGGVSSMLESEREGILYSCSDTEALAEAVCGMFADDALADEYGKRARERALKTHDAEANYRRLLEIYAQICGEKQ